LELLFEHKVGIKELPATLYEIDEDYFNESSNDLQEQDDKIPSMPKEE
jgi:hypothetical protein